MIYGTISISGNPFRVGANDLGGFVASTNNLVRGNFIGVGADGVTPLGYTGTGVRLFGDAKGNTIGGIEPGAGNIIARNGGGVLLGPVGDPDTNLPIEPVGNAIRGNSIYLNSGLGIDLQGDVYISATSGVTRNDNSDLAVGRNHFQNFPVLSSAIAAGGSITIQGRLNSTPNGVFQIDFFASEQMDASGYGEGQTYIDTKSVTTDAAGRGRLHGHLTGGDCGWTIHYGDSHQCYERHF